MHQYAGNPAAWILNVGLVDDSDLNPATAAALDIAPQNLADRTAYLQAKTGAYKLIAHVTQGLNGTVSSDWGGATVTQASAWTAFSGSDAVPFLVFAGVEVGDLVSARLKTHVTTTGPGGDAQTISLGYCNVVHGGGLTFAKIPGSGQYLPNPQNGGPLDIMGEKVVTIAGDVAVTAGVQSGPTAGTYQSQMTLDFAWVVDIWRPTAVAQ